VHRWRVDGGPAGAFAQLAAGGRERVRSAECRHAAVPAGCTRIVISLGLATARCGRQGGGAECLSPLWPSVGGCKVSPMDIALTVVLLFRVCRRCAPSLGVPSGGGAAWLPWLTRLVALARRTAHRALRARSPVGGLPSPSRRPRRPTPWPSPPRLGGCLSASKARNGGVLLSAQPARELGAATAAVRAGREHGGNAVAASTVQTQLQASYQMIAADLMAVGGSAGSAGARPEAARGCGFADTGPQRRHTTNGW
jgi:hypothetical protein